MGCLGGSSRAQNCSEDDHFPCRRLFRWPQKSEIQVVRKSSFELSDFWGPFALSIFPRTPGNRFKRGALIQTGPMEPWKMKSALSGPKKGKMEDEVSLSKKKVG